MGVPRFLQKVSERLAKLCAIRYNRDRGGADYVRDEVYGERQRVQLYLPAAGKPAASIPDPAPRGHRGDGSGLQAGDAGAYFDQRDNEWPGCPGAEHTDHIDGGAVEVYHQHRAADAAVPGGDVQGVRGGEEAGPVRKPCGADSAAGAVHGVHGSGTGTAGGAAAVGAVRGQRQRGIGGQGTAKQGRRQHRRRIYPVLRDIRQAAKAVWVYAAGSGGDTAAVRGRRSTDAVSGIPRGGGARYYDDVVWPGADHEDSWVQFSAGGTCRRS